MDQPIHWLTPAQSLGCGADPNKADNFGTAIEQADCLDCLNAYRHNDYPTTPALDPAHPSYAARTAGGAS